MKLPDIPSINPIPLYLILGLVITNLLTLLAWQSSAHKLDVMRLEAKAAEEKTKRIELQHEQITKDTVDGWKAALDYTRADWARRLRNASGAQMPGLSHTPARTDELPADALPLASQCVETTLQLIHLQGWVDRQRSAK